jgi:protoporphyrinogen/coproporphyrinogen III oxidase
VAGVPADAVVVTTPAFAAAATLASIAPGAASLLGTIPYAGVVMVTLAFPDAALTRPLDASGYLVPKPEQRYLTACSWASTKWAHWQPPGKVVLRASLGRYGNERALDLDDDAVLAAALADLGVQAGIRGDPTDVRITRWPQGFPQYLPGHTGKVDAIHDALGREAPGVLAAGAAYRGVGIPACIRQGRAAALSALTHTR